MTKSKFEGTGVALVTPFKTNGVVDFDALARILDYTAQGGVDYYVVSGTTGEPATMSKKEKQELLKFIIKNNSKKLPIVWGAGGNNTQEIVDALQETDLTGVDAILSVSPYYTKPSQEGIYQHYLKIADNSPLPVLLYNVPGRTSANVIATTTLRLAAHKNIIGIKEATSDVTQSIEIAKGKPEDFLLISGDDMLTLPMISYGGVGAISVLANAFPKKFSSMVRQSLQGNFAGASKLLFDFIEINPLMYCESSPVGIKTALAHLGLCADTVRLPLVPAGEKLKVDIKMNIEKYNLS
jgi:4-hydroxy-tetrahydrodipicolinate synthase